MAGSLQDQLLGAGLINKKKAKKITLEKQQSAKKNRKANIEVENEAAMLAEKATEEQRRKSQELNKQQKKVSEKKAIAAQIRQIIVMNQVDKEGEERHEMMAYNFTDMNKVKTLEVSTQQHEFISKGSLAIARLDEGYALIPKAAANKIIERDDDFIVLLNDVAKDQEVDEDDPYADYQVPDDLMW